MAGVVQFRDHALARLRARLGAAEEAREDLIAFARGHSGAVASIHEAVLAAIAAQGVDGLLECVTREWPRILTIDSIALALKVGDEAYCAGPAGVQQLAPQILDRALARTGQLAMRAVERGHPLFGADSARVRAEALVALDCGPGLPRGLLLIGQYEAHSLEDRHGGTLLLFLGRALGAMMRRWLTAPTD